MDGVLLRGLLVAAALGWVAHVEAQTPAAAQSPTAPAPVPTAPPPVQAPASAAAQPAAPPAAAAPEAAGAPVIQPPPQPSATEPVYVGPVQAPPVAAGPACYPECRGGYGCAAGRCVPACNPPCGSSERCTPAGTCAAVAKAIPAGAFSHDGFLLRVTSGFTIGNLSVDSADGGDTQRDGALFADLALDVGAAVIPNLIVRGRLWGQLFALRDSDFGKRIVGLSGGIGVGVDYYFMPINIRLGVTPSLAGITLVDVQEPDEERAGRARRSKAGFGLDLDAAKEWWVSSSLGIGVGVRLRFITVAPERIGAPNDGRLNSFQGGVHFALTFN